ncbi:Maf family protein [Corynebacterium uterequi]|uniref:Nucleoside triphosphate pyrophosphatase n=1 Tax=Corynebacterium uterequi TaxID=1072256 RepID=A0A0G3HEV3_9CORY|nr:Maf family nucleotide pyrophosphatase [Corynebacterium uterequi]AKK10503.1 MAF protein [Corynebacterium uterequi]
MRPRIVLASQSPSRLAVLTAAGVTPLVAPADVDERAIEAQYDSPRDVVEALAVAKASAVAAAFPNDVIIGGDSMLLIDGQLHGKPYTAAETVRRWHAQAGRAGELLTGHCLIYRGSSFIDTGRTTVHFADATAADIDAYAATGEPFGCAGAFTLEALGGWFIDRIEGDPSGVIGLSLPVVRRGLYALGFTVSDFWSASDDG